MQIFHEMLATGPYIRDMRRPGSDPIEHVQINLYIGLMSDGRNVQGSVGGTSQRHIDGYRVLESVLSQYL